MGFGWECIQNILVLLKGQAVIELSWVREMIVGDDIKGRSYGNLRTEIKDLQFSSVREHDMIYV